MLITNKHNLPQAYVDAVKETHPVVDKQYSVTSLLGPVRELLLKRRHYDEIEQDVSDMVWAIFGTAVHKIIEDADKTGFAEYELSETIINNYILTGICDLYNEELFAVEDHKTASVYKIINQDFDDWKKQGLMYAWMLRKKGYYVSRLRFHALMKDWSAKDKRQAEFTDKFYPEHPIWTWEYEITEQDMIDIEEFIKNKFEEIIKYESVSDDDLPMCTKEERWNNGDTYRVLKKGQKRALKVTKDRLEALTLANENQAVIEVVKGEDRKCKDYCLVCQFCKHWKENIE